MIPKPEHPEIGRELRVSELTPPQIVWVRKLGGAHGDSCTTMWVETVTEGHVLFLAGVGRTVLLVRRFGENRDSITDDSNATMRIYEYLGAP